MTTDLEALKALLAKCASGTLTATNDQTHLGDEEAAVWRMRSDGKIIFQVSGKYRFELQLLAALHNAAPDLIAAAERAERYKAALEMIAQGPEPMNDYLTGIRCGVEDRCLQNSVYASAEYGYEQGIDYCADIARQALVEEK